MSICTTYDLTKDIASEIQWLWQDIYNNLIIIVQID